MVLVTIDSVNCLIALENAEPTATHWRALIGLHDNSRVTISLPKFGASERNRQGAYASYIEEFQVRVRKVGLDHLPQLTPLARLGVTFWDNCVWTSPEMEQLESEIWDILAPANREVPAPGSSETVHRRWRNDLADVQAYWAHVWSGGEIFVSNDRRFMTRRDGLLKLGGRCIVTPESAVQAVVRDSLACHNGMARRV